MEPEKKDGHRAPPISRRQAKQINSQSQVQNSIIVDLNELVFVLKESAASTTQRRHIGNDKYSTKSVKKCNILHNAFVHFFLSQETVVYAKETQTLESSFLDGTFIHLFIRDMYY